MNDKDGGRASPSLVRPLILLLHLHLHTLHLIVGVGLGIFAAKVCGIGVWPLYGYTYQCLLLMPALGPFT